MAELIIGFAFGVIHHMFRPNGTHKTDTERKTNQTGGQKRKHKDSKFNVTPNQKRTRTRRSKPEPRRCACEGCTKCTLGNDSRCKRMRYGRLRNCDPCYRESLQLKKQKMEEMKEWVMTTMDDVEEDYDEDILESVGDWISLKGGNPPTQPIQEPHITDVLRPEGSDITKNITQFLDPYAESQLQGHNILPDERNATCAQLVTAINGNKWDEVKYLILGKGCITKGTSNKMLDKHPLLRAYHIAKYAFVRENDIGALRQFYLKQLKQDDAEELINLDFLKECNEWMKEMLSSYSFEPGVLHQKYTQWMKEKQQFYDYQSVMGGFTQDQLEWIILINFIIDELDVMLYPSY